MAIAALVSNFDQRRLVLATIMTNTFVLADLIAMTMMITMTMMMIMMMTMTTTTTTTATTTMVSITFLMIWSYWILGYDLGMDTLKVSRWGCGYFSCVPTWRCRYFKSIHGCSNRYSELPTTPEGVYSWSCVLTLILLKSSKNSWNC